ncbi:MAG: hypothetical protein N4A71_00335 [Carboxylicivirga sp.]|jgi:hypothetical protein|nr:hypothetical protein [Carboxylicivirga sp.]
MKNPKNLPLDLLKELSKVYSKFVSKYHVIQNEDVILSFTDMDKESTYHFRILSHSLSKGDLILNVEHSPKSSKETVSYNRNVALSQLSKVMENWDHLVNDTNRYISLIDPIQKSWEDDFYSKFELVDVDKDGVYDTERILILDEHLTNVSKMLEESKTEENESTINEIQDEISDLKPRLTNTSKENVVKRVSTIYAKIAKISTPLLKKLMTELTKKGIDKITTSAIEKGGEIIEVLGNAIT